MPSMFMLPLSEVANSEDGTYEEEDSGDDQDDQESMASPSLGGINSLDGFDERSPIITPGDERAEWTQVIERLVQQEDRQLIDDPDPPGTVPAETSVPDHDSEEDEAEDFDGWL